MTDRPGGPEVYRASDARPALWWILRHDSRDLRALLVYQDALPQLVKARSANEALARALDLLAADRIEGSVGTNSEGDMLVVIPEASVWTFAFDGGQWVKLADTPSAQGPWWSRIDIDSND